MVAREPSDDFDWNSPAGFNFGAGAGTDPFAAAGGAGEPGADPFGFSALAFDGFNLPSPPTKAAPR